VYDNTYGEPYTIDEIMRAAEHGPAVGGYILEERAARRRAQEHALDVAQRRTALFTKVAAIATTATAVIMLLSWLIPLHH